MTHLAITTPTLNVGAGSRLSAAAVFGSRLAIATVRAQAGEFDLTVEACTFFDLEDKQRAVQGLAGSLRTFLDQHAIRHLFLRKGPESGPHAITPIRTKLEFMVFRTRDVPVTLIPSHVVERWATACDISFSPPPAGMDSKLEQLRRSAVDTAAYALSKQGRAA